MDSLTLGKIFNYAAFIHVACVMVAAYLGRPSLAALGAAILTAAAGSAFMLLLEPTSLGVAMAVFFTVLLGPAVYRFHMLAISRMGQKQ